MKTQSHDTNEQTEKLLIELQQQTPFWKRAQQLDKMIETHRMLILADLRSRYPMANGEELKKRLAARLWSREDVIRVFNWDPEKEGY